jgi:hypothetical protein
MLIRTTASATKTSPTFVVALAVLMCVAARTSPAFGVDSTDALPTAAALYEQVRAPAAQDRPLAGLAPGFGTAADASLSDLMARLHYAFGGDLRLSINRAQPDERAILLKNSDAFVRTKVPLTVGRDWHGFLYADMGAADSALKWQSVAGIRAGHGVDLLGGWRHVTYRFSPGMGFDSLDFNGPFLGATLAW